MEADDLEEPEDLEVAVLDALDAVDDEAPAGTAPLEAARRRRALRSAQGWLDSSA
ncbi:MAG: hypothetical protein M0Z30_22140 [Actinomycetota bacterium]|nr:hypothetical protein [Actinomycetota bacterium]